MNLVRDGLIKCYFSGWRNTFNYKGKATRKEFWLFVLVNFIVLNAPAFAAEMMVMTWINLSELLLSLFAGFNLQTIFKILFIIPIISLGIRRMHDIGRSGWWFSNLLLSNIFIFILPAFIISLFSGRGGSYLLGIAFHLMIFISQMTNLSVIFYLMYLCCKPSLKNQSN